MYYFVGSNLGKTLTGIEKAQFNRLKLFENYGLNATCVFSTFNPSLHENAAQFGIEADVYSIYDYFQQSIEFTEEPFNWIEHWSEVCDYTIKYIPNTEDVRVYDDGNYIIYAHFDNDYYSQVKYINYFDKNGKKFKRDIYDSRGFLSVTKYLTVNQKVLMDHILDVDGNVVIEKYYDPEAEKPSLTRIVLNYKGEVYHLNHHSDLLTIFTNEIYRQGDIFFSDKNNVTAQGLVNAYQDIPVIAVLHSTHLKYEQSALLKNVKNTYKDVFDNIDRFSGIVVSTKQQKEDVASLIDGKLPVWNIPAGFTDLQEMNLNQPDSDKPRLISVARYAVEKQLDHQIRLVKRLKQDFTNIELHMFGAGPEHLNLKRLIEKENLSDNVLLRGFVTDLGKEYGQSHVNLLTSRMEGFSLALLESSSFGVPAVSYHIEYGPSEIISDGRSGYLIPLDDDEKLYNSVKDLLMNAGKQKQFSLAASKDANRYSESVVAEQWKNVLNAISK